MREPLPLLPIPLTDDLPDAVLDLQAVFNRAYDEGSYARLSRTYAENAIPSLSPDDAAWADALLRERGLR